MTTPSLRYRCPQCGFAVYNRRLPACERCAAALPAGLALTAEQQAFLDAEAARNEQARDELARDAEADEQRRLRRRGDGG